MSKSQKVKNRIKPELPGGFRDYAPQEALLKQRLIQRARKTFESFGFEPMETPAVERTEVLLGGEEGSDKIIFNVNSSTRSEYKSKDKLSLRFDLTVPLARFVAANPEIPKPFKRYQIGEVFRGESPQAGRYREFTQADIDIVGSSSAEADAEVIMVIDALLKELKVGDFTIKVNDRKLLNVLPAEVKFDPQRLTEIFRIIDKRDKIGESGVKDLLKDQFGSVIADGIISCLEKWRENLREGLSERNLLDLLKGLGPTVAAREAKSILSIRLLLDGMDVTFEYDPYMVRGLDYYTGTVFEAVLNGYPEIGSIFSGGRYDDLISRFTGQPIAAVGASLGVDRLVASTEKLATPKPEIIKTAAMVAVFRGSAIDYFKIAKELRSAGINTTIYSGNDKTLKAQLAYAVKKEIPYVLIYGDGEKKKGTVAIKNLATREQKEIPKNNLVEYFKK